jgi:acyl-CoA reductase-like NAD-dependent aldehyde dehydrogenase
MSSLWCANLTNGLQIKGNKEVTFCGSGTVTMKRERRVASQPHVGRVAINGMLDDPQALWGGFKHSGVGREFGKFGIGAFLEPKANLK